MSNEISWKTTYTDKFSDNLLFTYPAWIDKGIVRNRTVMVLYQAPASSIAICRPRNRQPKWTGQAKPIGDDLGADRAGPHRHKVRYTAVEKYSFAALDVYG